MTELPPSLSPRPDSGTTGSAPSGSDAVASATQIPATQIPASLPTPVTAATDDRPRVQRSDSGLTAPGVAVVVLAVSLVGLIVDRFTVDSGVVFGVAYVVSCLYAALQVRRKDLLAAVVIPPLVFFALTAGRALIDPGTTHTMSARGLQVASDLATLAPALWIGTALGAVIVLVRWRLGVRSSKHP